MVCTSDVAARIKSNQFTAKGLAPAIALALALGAGSPVSRAADAAPATSAPELTEVVITAQKRQQNEQDVPIAVIALSGQQLQDAGVTDIKNMTVLTPGLTVTSTTSENSTTARIRGIGTVGDNVGLESSVGVVIDGVYRPRNGVGFGDLGEIDRIEVLEGPQGELFGKNNDAGVINIVTDAAVDDLRGDRRDHRRKFRRPRDLAVDHRPGGRFLRLSALCRLPEARRVSERRDRERVQPR